MDYCIQLTWLTILLYIGIIFLTRPKCREEDKHQSTFGNLKIRKAETDTTLMSYSLLILLMFHLIISFLSEYVSIHMLAVIWVLLVLFCFCALYYRKSYYTVDDRQITFVKSGKVEWSLRWDEIDRVHKRFEEVVGGKSFFYKTLYDIQKKDGKRISNLPSTLESDFEKYLSVDKDEYDKAFRKWWITTFFITIGALLLFVCLVSWLC